MQASMIHRGTFASGTAATSGSFCKETMVPRHGSIGAMMSHYCELRVLGVGNFGRVALVQDRVNGQIRVCKTMSLQGRTQDEATLMRNEASIMAGLDHPQTVKLYEYAEDRASQAVALILEYVEGPGCETIGSAKSKSVTEATVAQIVQQLLLALAYCHSKGLGHRDVKPDNILLTSELSGSLECKLIDFGLSCTQVDKTKSTIVGTPAFMAPETVNYAPFSFPADMWSAGMTTLKLLLGAAPYERNDGNECLAAIRKHRSFQDFGFDDNKDWRRLSREARSFVQCLLAVEPSQRLAAVDALDHPWIAAHRPEPKRLTSPMAVSLQTYAMGTPQVIRRCAVIAASHLSPSEEKVLSQAFSGADADGDGLLSRDELLDAVEDVERWWWSSAVNVDVDALLQEAQLNQKALTYTEFVAACLVSESGREALAKQAFRCLDHDRDGRLCTQQIIAAFAPYHEGLLRNLPQQGSFGMKDWVTALSRQLGLHGSSSCVNTSCARKPARKAMTC